MDVSFENGVMHVIYSIMVFDNDAHPKCQTHELCWTVWKSRMMQDETRHCEMIPDGVAELC